MLCPSLLPLLVSGATGANDYNWDAYSLPALEARVHTKVSQGWAPLKARCGGGPHCLLQLPGISVFTQLFSPVLCVYTASLHFSSENTSHLIRDQPNPVQPHLK